MTMASTGVVAGLDADDFGKGAEVAMTGCTISRALAGVDAIDLQAPRRA